MWVIFQAEMSFMDCRFDWEERVKLGDWTAKTGGKLSSDFKTITCMSSLSLLYMHRCMRDSLAGWGQLWHPVFLGWPEKRLEWPSLWLMGDCIVWCLQFGHWQCPAKREFLRDHCHWKQRGKFARGVLQISNSWPWHLENSAGGANWAVYRAHVWVSI